MKTRQGYRWIGSIVVFGVVSIPVWAGHPPAVEAEKAIVVTAHPVASQVGQEILVRGGNAADAAVAVGFALAVVYPMAGNVGGGGFLLYAKGGGEEVRALDFRERAPRRAHEKLYLDADGEVIPGRSRVGWWAVGVPGSVRGLAELHAQEGSFPWKELLQPAIRLARDGFPVDRFLVAHLKRVREALSACPEARAIFFETDGGLPPEGSLLVQRDLAWTLTEIAEKGADTFYEGAVARKLVKAFLDSDGLIDAVDLASYEVKWREPIRIEYRGYEIYTMPPPSSGGICLGQLLQLAEREDLSRFGTGSSALYHRMIEWERHVYADRSRHLGDPDYYEVPASWLLSRNRIDLIAGRVDPDRATPSPEVAPGVPIGSESEETTHFSIVDSAGNALSCTTTLNSSFGSKVVAAGTGILLNNEMDDFSVKPGVPNLYGLVGGQANKVEPGKRMLSSMTPTIVRKGARTRWVLGTPGGSTIITTVFQVLLHVIDFGLPLADAVALRRIHHQWEPDLVFLERGEVYGADCLEGLVARGHAFRTRGPIGDVQAIEVRPTGGLLGVSDPRGQGSAAGR